MLEKGDEPVPGYRLEAFLGRGQYGEVWRATSPGGVRVALKFLNLEERQGLKEFRAIQQIKTIRHPHLASVTALWLLDDQGEVLDEDVVGSYGSQAPQRETLVPRDTVESDRSPHRLVVAALLCDKNLLDRLAECQAEGLPGIPVDELLRYMEEAAKGIDFLNSQRHDLGDGPIAIQHCDIKPANIMLTGDSVMICDFGVAAFLSNPRIAATGTSMAGSPAYMSPECTECKPSAASDQYSLAITYAELRTGQLPFHGESWIEVIEAHRSGNLDLSGLPAGEQEVIRKATSVDPADRYPSGVAMVRALRRVVESAELAQPPARPLRTFALAAAALVLLAAVGWGAFQLLPLGNGAQPVPVSNGSAPAETTVVFQVLPPDADVRVDEQAVAPDAEGRVSVTRPRDALLDIEVRKAPEFLPARRQFSMTELLGQTLVIRLERNVAYLRELAQTHAQRAFEIVDGDEAHLPNLDEAVVEYRRALELDEARYGVVPLFVRSLHEGETKQEYSFTIRCLALHPERPWLVGRLQGAKIALWNLHDLDAPPTLLHEHANHMCNVVTAGSYVASADLAGEIRLTRLDDDGRPLETRTLTELSGLELAITPDQQWLIAGDYEGQVRGHKLDPGGGGQPPVAIGRHERSVRGLVITPDSRWAITAGEDGTVCRWSLQTPDPAADDARLGTRAGDVFSLVISPTGRWAAFGGEAKQGLEYLVSRIDLTRGTLEDLPHGHTAPISILACDQFGPLRQDPAAADRLASGSENGQIQVYDGDAPQLLPNLHTAVVKSLSYCPAPGWLVSGSDDGKVGLWDLHHAQARPLPLQGNAGRVVQVIVTPRWLVAGYYNGAILLWDIRRCILVQRAANEQGLELQDPSSETGPVKT